MKCELLAESNLALLLTSSCMNTRIDSACSIMVAATSCRMVSFTSFEKELADNDLYIIEKGTTTALPEFDNLMYAVVKKK